MTNNKNFRFSKIVLAFTVILLLTFSSLFSLAAKSDLPRANVFKIVMTRLQNFGVSLVKMQASKEMLDPSVDEEGAFSYFARPSYQLGVRGEQYATQVVEGHLWTGSAEWFPVVGNDPQKVDKRIWTLSQGYLPCINYSVQKDGVLYKVSAFHFWIKGESGPTANFVRIRAKNISEKEKTAKFGGGFMYGPKDHRCQDMVQNKYSVFSSYEMTDFSALKDSKIIYLWQKKPDTMLAKLSKEYIKPFTGAKRTEPVCISLRQTKLKPGEEKNMDFIVPQYPADISLQNNFLKSDHDERFLEMKNHWNGWIERGAVFKVSEKKVYDATRSYVVPALTSQNIISDNEVEQHVNRLHYNRFWLRDSAFFVTMYERWGYPEIGQNLSRHFFGFQKENGNFLSNPGQLDGWGQAMWAFGSHVRYTGDEDFAKEVLPYINKGVDWLELSLSEDPFGVMPETNAFDNETITGHYTGHNFWALAGLIAAADVARTAGDTKLEKRCLKIHKEYLEDFLSVLRKVAKDRDGVIPPGLDIKGGTDWGNLLAVYPWKTMDPFDPLVTDTFNYFRDERMQEGIAMWHQSLHHYITERVAQTALVRGEQEHVLDDFYGMLLHTGSCHEGFEWTVFPWGARDYCVQVPGNQICNFPPHGWYAADMNLLFRNMLVREDGENLHLCSTISPEWAKPGDSIEVRDAPVWLEVEKTLLNFKLSYTLKFDENSAFFKIDHGPVSKNLNEKGNVIFHVPYFLDMKNVKSIDNDVELKDGTIEFPLKSCEIQMQFKRKDLPARNYKTAVEKYKEKYKNIYIERHGLE